MTNEQIDSYMSETRKAIQDTTKDVVPQRRAINSVDKYINPKITKLNKSKDQQLKNLAWCLKTDPLARKKITKDTKSVL